MKKQLTNEKYLNLFKNDSGYFWVERVNTAGAVTVLPVVNDAVIFIKEYRPAADKWIYQLPAGLIDAGESPMQAAVRELKEETGLKALSIREVSGGYTSAGLTNEYATMFYAECVQDGKQDLQGGEKITLVSVPKEDVKEFVQNNKENFCLRSALLAFLYV